MKKNAFTLVELVITLAIMGILGALVVPSFFEYQRAKNLDISAQLIETSLSQGFSSSRATPRIFGVQALKGSSEIETFECDYPDCTQKEGKSFSITTDVAIQDDFEVLFLPPHGDISPDSFEGASLDIEVKNGKNESRILRIYKSSGLTERILSS